MLWGETIAGHGVVAANESFLHTAVPWSARVCAMASFRPRGALSLIEVDDRAR